MKQILAMGAIAFSTLVAAEPVMVADQGAKGKVVLTTERHEGCSSGERIAYLTRLVDPKGPPDSITYWGCWAVAREVVHIHYFIGNDSRYLRSDFNYDDLPHIPIPHRRVPRDDDPEQSGA